MTTPTLINKHSFSTSWPTWACRCCGARIQEAKEDTDFSTTEVGIDFYAGKHGEAIDTDTIGLHHVETSAGILTIVIEYGNN